MHFAGVGVVKSPEHPFFEDISPRNVTVRIDDVAVLKCRVMNKGNRTVSRVVGVCVSVCLVRGDFNQLCLAQLITHFPLPQPELFHRMNISITW